MSESALRQHTAPAHEWPKGDQGPGQPDGQPDSGRPDARAAGHEQRGGHLHRADAGGVPGRAGSDHRGDRAADHRRGPARREPADLGDHGLPADRHHRAADLRQARRPVRAQGPVHLRHRRVPGRLDPVRAVAEHGRADRLPCPAGGRGRRSDDRGPGHHRGRGAAARARQATWASSARCSVSPP